MYLVDAYKGKKLFCNDKKITWYFFLSLHETI